jgi:HSP20 family molecular chaperone IbpA
MFRYIDSSLKTTGRQYASLMRECGEVISFFNKMNSVPKFPFCNVSLANNNKDLLLEFAVAGCNKESIDIRVNEHSGIKTLVITGNERLEKDGVVSIVKGISNSPFRVKFALPPQSDLTKISSECKDGILTVIVPQGALSPNEIKVQVN